MAVTVAQWVYSGETSNTPADGGVLAATTAGNTIVAICQCYGFTGASSAEGHVTGVTDTAGNSYTVKNGSSVGAETPVSSPNYFNNVDIAYATGIVGGSPHLTITLSQACYLVTTLVELTPSQFDQWAGTATTTATTSFSVGPITPSANGALLLAAFNDDGIGGGIWTAGSGWTLMLNTFAGGGGSANESLAQATAASVSAPMTLSSSAVGTAIVASFTPVPTSAAITASAVAVAHATATVATPAIALVQSATVGTVGSVSRAVTLPGASVSGHTLVVGVHIYGYNVADVVTITSLGDGTNTFVPVGASSAVDASGASYWLHTVFYVATNITGLATETVSMVVTSPGGGGYLAMDCWELTGGVFDQAAEATGVGAALSAGSVTPSSNGGFACAIFTTDGGGGTWTPQAGWTLLNGTAQNGSESIAQATAAALSPSIGYTASGHWTASAITLVPPSTGAPAITASATAVGGAAAPLTAQAKLTAAGVGVGVATAAVRAPTKLTASATAVGATTATVTSLAPAAITATAAAISASTATLTAPTRLAPQAIGVGQATLALTVPGVVFLTPAATAIGLASATVTAPTLTPQPLTATAQAQAAAVCLVTSGAIPVTPVASAVGSASTTLTAQANLTMSAAALSAAAISVTSGGASIAGSATGIAQVTVVMRVGMQLTLAAQGLGTASAIFRVPQGLQANATALGTTSCILGFPGSLRPAARAISSAAATVTAPPYTKVHLLAGTSMALTLTLGDTTAYDLQISASAARDETVNTV